MRRALTDDTTSQKPLRLWPGVVAVVLLWLLWFVVPIVAPDSGLFAIFGGVACGLAVLIGLGVARAALAIPRGSLFDYSAGTWF